jgi:hypothetical protein
MSRSTSLPAHAALNALIPFRARQVRRCVSTAHVARRYALECPRCPPFPPPTDVARPFAREHQRRRLARVSNVVVCLRCLRALPATPCVRFARVGASHIGRSSRHLRTYAARGRRCVSRPTSSFAEGTARELCYRAREPSRLNPSVQAPKFPCACASACLADRLRTGRPR